MFNQRKGGLPPVDEAWWRDVLHDPRARLPTAIRIEADDANARYRLDRQRPEIFVTCPCGKSATLDRDEMIQQVGPNMNVLHLVREWMPCRERNKLANNCRAMVQ